MLEISSPTSPVARWSCPTTGVYGQAGGSSLRIRGRWPDPGFPGNILRCRLWQKEQEAIAEPARSSTPEPEVKPADSRVTAMAPQKRQASQRKKEFELLEKLPASAPKEITARLNGGTAFGELMSSPADRRSDPAPRRKGAALAGRRRLLS